MPLYEFRCGACGHELEVLQKVSAPAPVDCPACHQPHLQKKLTAAGFQLKGTGWYVTDFRGGNGPTSEPAIKSDSAASSSGGSSTSATTTSGSAASSSESSVTAAPSSGGADSSNNAATAKPAAASSSVASA